MSVRIMSRRIWVMDRDVSDHSLGHKLLVAVFSDQLHSLFHRQLFRQSYLESSGKLRVPVVLDSLYSIPERVAVSVLRRSIHRKHYFGVDDAALVAVILRPVAAFIEEAFTGLVCSLSNSRLTFRSLAYLDLVVWAWHSYRLLSYCPKKKRPYACRKW